MEGREEGRKGGWMGGWMDECGAAQPYWFVSKHRRRGVYDGTCVDLWGGWSGGGKGTQAQQAPHARPEGMAGARGAEGRDRVRRGCTVPSARFLPVSLFHIKMRQRGIMLLLDTCIRCGRDAHEAEGGVEKTRCLLVSRTVCAPSDNHPKLCASE